MGHTTHYVHLIRRNETLQKAFLPSKRSPTGNYHNQTYERVRGYILLVHAEIEYYFEEITERIMKDTQAKWEFNHEATKTAVALMAYCTKDFHNTATSTNDQNKTEDLDYRFKKACSIHYEYVRAKNHGIKESNVLALLLPIGVFIDDLDNDLLIALNSFGTDRGLIAHSTGRARQQISPEDAETKVADLLRLLDTFDEKMLIEYHLEPAT